MQPMGLRSVLWKLSEEGGRGKMKQRKRENRKQEERERERKGGNRKTRERIPIQERGSTFDRCAQIEMVRTRPLLNAVRA